MTTLIGKAKPGKKSANQPAQEIVDEAVTEQRDLLAEFEKVANELNTVLANMEGSTLVKRLKAASRQQYTIAGRINDRIEDSFGTTGIEIALEQSPSGRKTRPAAGASAPRPAANRATASPKS